MRSLCTGVLVVGVFTGANLPARGQFGDAESAKIAHFRMAGPLAEAPSEFGLLTFGAEPPSSLKSLLERF